MQVIINSIVGLIKKVLTVKKNWIPLNICRVLTPSHIHRPQYPKTKLTSNNEQYCRIYVSEIQWKWKGQIKLCSCRQRCGTKRKLQIVLESFVFWAPLTTLYLSENWAVWSRVTDIQILSYQSFDFYLWDYMKKLSGSLL